MVTFRRFSLVMLVVVVGGLLLSGCPAPEPESTTTTAKPKEKAAVPFPAQKPDFNNGKAIYEKNCLSCHGASGDGKGPAASGFDPPPANFTDRPFVARHMPAEFWESITDGLRKMPPFKGSLSDVERWDVLFYLRFFATSDQKVAKGKETYTRLCVPCHGEKGDGTGPAGAALKPSPANFGDLKHMNSRSDNQLLHSIEEGLRRMPSFETLTDEERNNVLDFERTFSYVGKQ